MLKSSSRLKTLLPGLALLSQPEQSRSHELSEVEPEKTRLTDRQARLIQTAEELIQQMNSHRNLIPLPIPLSMVRQILITAAARLSDDEIEAYFISLSAKAEWIMYGDGMGTTEIAP